MSTDGSGWGPGRRTRKAIDGVPQPGKYRDLGGGQPPKSGGCAVTLLGLLGAGWLLDLLLAGSRAIT